MKKNIIVSIIIFILVIILAYIILDDIPAFTLLHIMKYYIFLMGIFTICSLVILFIINFIIKRIYKNKINKK